MNSQPQHFAPLARLLHWLMALMIIAMLFIGAGMVTSVSARHEWLIHLHKPLGVTCSTKDAGRLVYDLLPEDRTATLAELDDLLVDDTEPGEATEGASA